MSTEESRIPTAAVTIRRLTEADLPALARLAELDSDARLDLPALGAEVEGVLLAAISLDGHVISDPWSRTGELRSLLELRLGQLNGRSHARRHGGRMLRGDRAQGSVGSSPSGTRSRLLTMIPRF